MLSREPCINSQATVSFSKCLQLSVSLSLETVFRNQLVSKKQSLRGSVFANSFPTGGPHVTLWNITFLCIDFVFAVGHYAAHGSRAV
jgi:hypothetical protein